MTCSRTGGSALRCPTTRVAVQYRLAKFLRVKVRRVQRGRESRAPGGRASVHRIGHTACNARVVPGYPTHPAHPERVCWGCDEYCPADDPSCGKDTVRTPHPVELFGDDWNRETESEADPVNETTHARVVEALRCVVDPEVGINIVDLGVLYDVQVSGSSIRVSLTLTSPSCPLGEQIQLEATRRVRALKGVTDVQVVRLWDPPWTPERMSPAARAALGSSR